jgi:hypothetical protein
MGSGPGFGSPRFSRILTAFKRLAVCGAGLILASSVSCATAMDLETGDITLIDAGLVIGGQPGFVDPGTGGFPVTGSGGVVGAGGFTLPVGKGGSVPGAAGAMAAGGRSAVGGRGRGGATNGGMSSVGSGGAPRGNGGAAVGAGGMSGPPSCTPQEKICGGVCAAPSPKVGCGTTGCEPCTMTAPKNGYITCVSGACAFDCLSGYTKKDGACEGPPPSVGGGSCPNSPIGCPDCGPLFGPGCCAQNKCGCSPIPWTVGILGCI